MRMQAKLVGLCAMLSLGIGVVSAQTAVTTTGSTAGKVPVMSDGATIVDSAITQADGNIGIGTAFPQTSLETVGIVSAYLGAKPYGDRTGVRIGAAASGQPFMDFRVGDDSSRMQLQFNGVNTGQERLGFWGDCGGSCADAERVSFLSSGGVGIGTTAPTSVLTISEPAGASVSLISTGALVPTGFTSGTGGLTMQQLDNSVGWISPDWPSAAILESTGAGGLILDSYGDTPIKFQIHRDTLMTLASSGNVGIGTTVPTAKLEVNGSIVLTAGSAASITFPDGHIQSKAWDGTTYGDFAESVDVIGDREQYEPGDVIVMDKKSPGMFAKSNTPYSKLVSGIYSTKPGLTGRRESISQNPTVPGVPMAMTGIVPTKVTAENGPIEVGDLLVTSSTQGYAMRGTDQTRLTGAIVGKAMGQLDLGKGVIEVLVTLQ